MSCQPRDVRGGDRCPKAGSVVVISVDLPIDFQPGVCTFPREWPEEGWRLPTILVVDDSSHTRYVTGRVLRRAGFDVCEAASARHALQAAVSATPDLIVLDIRLPDIDGLEVCRSLKRHPATAKIPIILKTASSRSEQERVDGLAAGADAYLEEPVDPDVFLGIVRNLLGSQSSGTDGDSEPHI